MKCPDVAMPERWQHLERDQRGFPKPLFLILPDGSCDFQGMDFAVVFDLQKNRLCGICGEIMEYWVAFVGGPKSTANRIYGDPPFHPECARAAMSVCPYMLYGGWDRTRTKHAQEALAADPSGDASRVKDTYIAITRKWRVIFPGNTMLFEARPAKTLEHYENGIRIP